MNIEGDHNPFTYTRADEDMERWLDENEKHIDGLDFSISLLPKWLERLRTFAWRKKVNVVNVSEPYIEYIDDGRKYNYRVVYVTTAGEWANAEFSSHAKAKEYLDRIRPHKWVRVTD